MPSEEEKQACLQWVAAGRGSNIEKILIIPLLFQKGVAAGRGSNIKKTDKSPSILEGVPEGRGSNIMFTKYTIISQLKNFTDHHSHILYGVDDGVKTLEVSLKVLQRYEEIGIAEVWCTPHIMEDVPNTTEALRARFAELKAAYNGPIRLHLAAEYMMDQLFEERLEKNDLLPLGEEGNHLLVETSYFTPPMDLQGILKRIKKGYFPVLAHPERYIYMSKDYYSNLKNMGVLFQLNLSSLAGAYGPEAEKKARWLLKKKYYNYVGSDLHSLRNMEFWEKKIPKRYAEAIKLLNK